MNRRDVLGVGVFAVAQAIEQLSRRRSMTRDHGLRRDFVERNQNEGALGHARMRNLQIGLTEAKVSQHQDIQIEGARAVAWAERAVAAVLALEVEQRIEQRVRRKRRFEHDDCVEKSWLLGEADGTG